MSVWISCLSSWPHCGLWSSTWVQLKVNNVFLLQTLLLDHFSQQYLTNAKVTCRPWSILCMLYIFICDLEMEVSNYSRSAKTITLKRCSFRRSRNQQTKTISHFSLLNMQVQLWNTDLLNICFIMFLSQEVKCYLNVSLQYNLFSYLSNLSGSECLMWMLKGF